jgi:hypothetical protein
MNRKSNAFAVVLAVVFAVCPYACYAQTIPPGVGPRHYAEKVAHRNDVLRSGVNGSASNATAATDGHSVRFFALQGESTDTSCTDLKDLNSRVKWGPAKTIAFRAVCGMDTNKYTAAQIAQGIKFIDNNINDGASYADAISGVNNPDSNQPAEVLVKSAINVTPHIDDIDCNAVYNSDTKQFDYRYGLFLPASHHSCGQAGVLNFFNVTKSATFGNTVQYLYNPKVGASQFGSDLITAVFPQGFQVVLAGTGTVPTGQSASQGSSNPPATQTTSDPVALAVQKIEAGGDFNLRFSLPLLSTLPGNTAWSTYLQPSVGFVLGNTSSQSNAAGAQVAYSSSNQYVISLPVESYFETSSITGDNSNGLTTATLFADLRYGGNILSPEYQKTIGIPNRIFQLGQASAGINFAGSFRIGFQYFFGGPKQAYVLANANGQTSSVNTSVKGFHMVLTYSPKKSIWRSSRLLLPPSRLYPSGPH